jgi:hypothetical protein
MVRPSHFAVGHASVRLRQFFPVPFPCKSITPALRALAPWRFKIVFSSTHDP